jgi:hypothetical protein
MRGEKKRKKGHKLFDFSLFFYSSLVPLLLFSLQEKKEMSCRVSVPRCPRPCGFARGEQHKKMYKTHREETREAKQEEDEEKKSKLSEMEATTFCAPVYYYTHAAR